MLTFRKSKTLTLSFISMIVRFSWNKDLLKPCFLIRSHQIIQMKARQKQNHLSYIFFSKVRALKSDNLEKARVAILWVRFISYGIDIMKIHGVDIEVFCNSIQGILTPTRLPTSFRLPHRLPTDPTYNQFSHLQILKQKTCKASRMQYLVYDAILVRSGGRGRWVATPLRFPEHLCPPSSLVSSKRGAGAGLGVAMLRGEGIPLIQKFQSFIFSKIQYSKIPIFQIRRFKIPGFQHIFSSSSKYEIQKLLVQNEAD